MTSDIPELIQKSAVEILDLLRSKEINASDLLDTLETRIEQVDNQVNALPTLCFDRAREFLNKTDLSNTTLCGLPVTIKDLEDVSGVRTTYGSKLFENHIPETSDILVEHLENNGGVVYAKSNTPEFGTGGNTDNYVHGATLNPWNTKMSAAGSSGGAAASLTTGTAWLAQGSDMGGSLRNPASFCNIVGLRPSIGRVVSNMGGKAYETLSTCGPMARNVADCALLLDAMCGHNPSAPQSLPAPTKPFLDSANNPKLPKRIAFSMDMGITPVDPKTRAVIASAIDTLANNGCEIISAQPDFSGLQESFHVLRAQSYASGMRQLFEDNADALNPKVAWNIEQGLSLSPKQIDKAESIRVDIIKRTQAFFQEYELILCPTTIAPPYPIDQGHVGHCDGHQFENYYQWLSIAYAFTISLSPAMSLPCGFTRSGLPVGLQIASAALDESTIFSAAAAMEQIFNLHTTRAIDPHSPD